MSKIDVGIIGAMDIEVDMLISEMSDRTEIVIGGIRFYSGRLYSKKVVVAKCGIGKVFAAICAQTMILEFSPKIIVNTGVAGALASGIRVMDTVIATSVVQHDMDTSALGDPKGLISGINIVYIDASSEAAKALCEASCEVGASFVQGIIASGDKFISDSQEKAEINACFGALACEMEGAAIGQTCYVNGVPFAVIRAISDGEGAEMDYVTFSKMAAEQSSKIVKCFIKRMGK